MLGKETDLWYSIHSLPDLDVDVSIFGYFVGDIVLIENIFGGVAEFEAHVFVAGYMGVEVEILGVNSHEPGSRVEDDTVEEELHYEDIGGGCSTVVSVVYSVAADGDTCAVGITLLWYVVDHNPTIGEILPA